MIIRVEMLHGVYRTFIIHKTRKYIIRLWLFKNLFYNNSYHNVIKLKTGPQIY